MSSVSHLLRVFCTLVMTHHDWFQGGSPLPTALVLKFSLRGVSNSAAANAVTVRFLLCPPCHMGSGCFVSTKKKLCDLTSAWLLISCLPLFVSPCHLVSEFVGAQFSAVLVLLFDCLIPLFASLGFVFSFLPVLLRLRYSRSGSLVLLLFGSLPLSFCSFFSSVHFRSLELLFSSSAVLWFSSLLPNTGRSAPVPLILLIFRDWILGNPFQ